MQEGSIDHGQAMGYTHGVGWGGVLHGTVALVVCLACLCTRPGWCVQAKGCLGSFLTPDTAKVEVLMKLRRPRVPNEGMP